MRFPVLVEVRLRPGIADPEGSTIERALANLGYSDVSEVRVGKAIRLVVEARDEAGARARAEELCRTLLANPVLEDAEVRLEPPADAGLREGGDGASAPTGVPAKGLEGGVA